MGPGPGWMMAQITAVRCMWQHLLQAKQLGRVGESQDKELGAERETAEGRDEKRRMRRSGCLYKLSQDMGNVTLAN